MQLIEQSNVESVGKNISELISNKFSGNVSGLSRFKMFKNELSGYSTEMLKAVATSGQFDKATAELILRTTDLNDEVIDSILTSEKFANNLGKSINPIENFGKAIKRAGKNILEMGKSIGMFLLTNPIGWIIDAIAAFATINAIYKKVTTSQKEATEAVQNSITESQNQIKSVREQKDTVDQLSKSYEKLSKGVNTSTNENISLSTDSYKEYLDTCNQIADLYPELVTGYDSQGNAILSLKGNVDQLTDAYKKAQQEAYATAYLGSTDEDGKTTSGIKSIEKEFKYATDTDDPGDNLWDTDFSTNKYIDSYKKMLKLNNDELRNLGETSVSQIDGAFAKYQAALEQAGITWKDLVNASDAELADYRGKLQQQLTEYQKIQTDAVSNAKSSIEGYMKGVTDASGNALASGYDKLTEKQQNLATSLLSSLDLDTLQAFEDSGDFEGAAKKWIDNLVSSVSNMSATAKNAYDKLQDSIANPDDLTGAAIENIDKYLDTLGSELNISKDKLKEVFNLEDIFDTQTSFDNLVKQYLGEDTFNELSNGAKKAAESVDEYGNAVKEAGKSSVELLASQQAP